MKFTDKLLNASRKNKSWLCIGLDPDPELMPEVDVLQFNKAIIEATCDLVCAYKPNLAFYEALGAEGLIILEKTVKHIRHIGGDIPVIGDAKRGDIGNTARAYAKALFSVFGFDAATVNPYLGFDSVKPFIQYQDKGVFILCLTSTASAADFQSLRSPIMAFNCDRCGKEIPLPSETFKGSRMCPYCQNPYKLDIKYDVFQPQPTLTYLRHVKITQSKEEKSLVEKPLFEHVALKANQWNKHGNIGLVVGATYPEELRLIRQSYPDILLLIPGIGAQGGDLASAVSYGMDSRGEKAIINVSRQILYASKERDFAQAARNVAEKIRSQINSHLKAK